MLTVFDRDGVEERAVAVVLSGNRPRSVLEGEARRLVQQGGVSINGETLDRVALSLDASAGQNYRFKVGKRKFLDILFA